MSINQKRFNQCYKLKLFAVYLIGKSEFFELKQIMKLVCLEVQFMLNNF